MQKIIVVLTSVMLLISANLYAQEGDLIAPGDAAGGRNIQLPAGEADEYFKENFTDDSAASNPAVGAAANDTKDASGLKDKDVKDTDKVKDEEPVQDGAADRMSALSSMGSGQGPASISEWSLKPVQVTQAGNSGAAATSIPIIVPPGRKGIEPRISLNYNSNNGNGWIGVGWGFDMGAIQRSTKRGVNYNANDYVVAVNGSASELVSRGDWGSNYYYGAKIEGAFSKYYKNPSTGGWEVTTKDGTKYYYGTNEASRQNNGANVFKWCLDKVQDTNGNYMTITYWKDQGEIYLDRIDYTGSTAGLNTTNYVKFYLEGRTDVPSMYTTNSNIKTSYRLKTIEVVANGSLVRAYSLSYTYSSNTFSSLLGSVQQYGNDVVINGSGIVTGGTTLPAIEYAYNSDVLAFTSDYPSTGWCGTGELTLTGDFNGDGMQDVFCRSNSNMMYVKLSTGSTFGAIETWGNDPICLNGSSDKMGVGDFDGDGMSDLYCINSTHNIFIHKSTGEGFSTSLWKQGWVCSTSDINGGADFDGDGKTDIWCKNRDEDFFVTLSNGDNFGAIEFWGDSVCTYATSDYISQGDFNGDGKTDLVCLNAQNALFVHESTGSGFSTNRWMEGWVCSNNDINSAADMNGDGKTDIWCKNRNEDFYVTLSTGESFGGIEFWGDSVCTYATSDYISQGDFNGDGKTDLVCLNAQNALFVHESTGSSFNTNLWDEGWPCYPTNDLNMTADVNGDGKTDMMCVNSVNNLYATLGGTPNIKSDLLSSISNGLGGTTVISYKPSSDYDNCIDINGKNVCLPFIVQTFSSITINDGNGISSTTNYIYEGGYFDYADREYRGFGYVKATATNQTTNESWFKQDSIFEGLPEEQITKDSSGNIYTRTYNTFLSISPYTGVNFPYLSQKDDYVYDGTSTAKQAATSFTYDSYGNITRKYLHGDVSISGDERDEYTEYTYNTTDWLVSLPSHTYLKDSGGTTRAQAWYTYDTKGNLLTKTDWLSGGTNPVTTFTYDSYGNVATVRDPRNNTTTITYDTTTRTYPVTVQNPLGHTAQKTYDYKFGKVLTETDPNNNTTTYQYDVFGRPAKVINPNDGASTYGTMSFFYQNFGTVGSQKVVTYATTQSGTGNFIWSEAYFDGLGRTMKTKMKGPDGKRIEAKTTFNDRGLVASESFPYFVNTQGNPLETPRWRAYQYDPIGRIIRTDNPDGTYATSSYLKGVLTYIDPNSHKKVEGKDIYGRTIKIEEYTGTSPSFTLYATTTYEYDVLGNLKKVTDANNNQTTMTYDTLSRKTSMTDPDMGYWTYQYDANGNLTSQTDAKSKTITFTYDALNRITLKNYTTGTDVNYTYDQTFSTYPKGRLTTVTDASGTAKFYYDKLGRTIKTIKTVDSVNYTTEATYDALSRTDTIKYPDNMIVKYEYDTGGNLYRVKNNSTGLVYASYTGYNALGQIGRTDFGNGVNTIYQYLTQNNRLYSITTSKQSTGFINLLYTYDSIGNITGITDYLNSTKNRTYGYDDLNRMTSASSSSYGGTLTWQYNKIGNMTYNSRVGNYTYGTKPHAVTQAGADTYTYDANGNMTSGAGRTFTYDYDNRATSVVKAGAATISIYDASGQRVKKAVPGATTIYIGKLYECTNGICTKYIFGNSDRIASIEGTNNRYYHTDHLGSSSVITDQNGVSVQSIYYYPYGEMHTVTGTDIARHKFTGQEYDAETGLYYYNARYYDPKLARFITADVIVPEAFNPQALNRYSYVINNPLKYTDPSGHGWWDVIINAVVGAVVGAVAAGIQSDWDGDAMLKGAGIGAVAGIVGGAVGSYVGGTIGCAAYCTPTMYYSAAVVGGAAGGAAAGATASAMYGGNVWQGAMYGAIGGAAFGAIGSAYGDSLSWDRVVVSGLAGGGVSELAGGKFGEGFMYAAGSAALFWAYTEMVGYSTDYGSGEDLPNGKYEPNKAGQPPAHKNVFGRNLELSGDYWGADFWKQGGPVSNTFNRIPGMNAVAGLHDYWMNNIASFNLVTSVGTMIPAAAMTYGTALGGHLAPVTVPISTTIQRYTDE